MSGALDTSPVASAGKIHLLDLGALKARLGNKWTRMAQHVQMFFEAAIRRALGPGDTFCAHEELSYLVMFRDLTPAEAELKCIAISEEVCRRLFGANGEHVSLRNLVAHVGLASAPSGPAARVALNSVLERDGKEVLVARGGEPENEPHSIPAIDLRWALGGGQFKRQRISLDEIGFVYRPLWDLTNQVVLTYLCQPIAASVPQDKAGPMEFWLAEGEEEQARLDLYILRECLERARRLRGEGLRIVLAVPVHFATISRTRSWRQYHDLLGQAPEAVRRDVAFVILGVDHGVPHVRLAQEIPKLSRMCYRVFCVVDRCDSVNSRFAKTGAHGVGAVLGAKDDDLQCAAQLKEVAQEAHSAAIDAFVLGLRSTSTTLLAMHAGIRYLEGSAVRPIVDDPRHGFAHGLEDLYRFKRATS